MSIAGQAVTLPLCRLHFQKLFDSPDPAALATIWASDDAAESRGSAA
jgi:hypothetical protein